MGTDITIFMNSGSYETMQQMVKKMRTQASYLVYESVRYGEEYTDLDRGRNNEVVAGMGQVDINITFFFATFD